MDALEHTCWIAHVSANTSITVSNLISTTNSISSVTNDFRVEISGQPIDPIYQLPKCQILKLHSTNSVVLSDVLECFRDPSSLIVRSLTLHHEWPGCQGDLPGW